MPSESITSARKMRAQEVEVRSVELRKQGLSYRAIGQQLKTSDTTVRKALKRVFTRIREETSEKAEELIQLEAERLDDLFNAIWGQAIKGDYAAIDRIIRIMDRRAKLLGLDAPEVLHTEEVHKFVAIGPAKAESAEEWANNGGVEIKQLPSPDDDKELVSRH